MPHYTELSVAAGHLERKSSWTLRPLLPLGVLIALYLALVFVFWLGFLGSDDAFYWKAADGWLQHFPYVGNSHFALRHTVVVPIALARLVFGDGMIAMSLPTILYAVATIALVYVWVRVRAGATASVLGVLLMITNPQFVLLSSSASIDHVELFFVVAAMAAFDLAIRQSRNTALLLLSGLLLALAFLTRETAVFALGGFFVLFCFGFALPRRRYLLIALGFAVPMLLEVVWLWIETGRLFYRFRIDFNHDLDINRWVPQGSAVPLIHPLIDPLTMMLLNHNFGLSFWTGFPVLYVALRRLGLRTRPELTIVTAIALAWIVGAAGLWTKLVLIPRYFLVPSLILAALTGVALAHAFRRGQRRVAGAILLASLLVSVVSLSLDNRSYMWGEKTLVELVQAPGAPVVHTNPTTLRRASLLLRWDNLSDRVVDSPTGPGEIYFFDPSRDTPSAIQDHWVRLRVITPPPTIGQRVAMRLVGRDHIPDGVWQRLGAGHPPVDVYRAP